MPFFERMLGVRLSHLVNVMSPLYRPSRSTDEPTGVYTISAVIVPDPSPAPAVAADVKPTNTLDSQAHSASTASPAVVPLDVAVELEFEKPASDWLNHVERVLLLVSFTTVNKNYKVKAAEIVKIVNTPVRTIADLQKLA